MPELSQRQHKALYGLVMAESIKDHVEITAKEMWQYEQENWDGHIDAQLLKSKADASAVMKELRDKEMAERTVSNSPLYNKVTVKGRKYLFDNGAPDDVEL